MGLSWALISYFSVVFAGVCVAAQQVLNANLRAEIGSPWLAATVSYFVGFVIMLLISFLSPATRVSDLFTRSASPVSYLGGVLGAAFIGIAILMIPRLGAATSLALIVIGQMLAALLMDHFGMFGLPQQSISLIRCLGVMCLIGGVVLVRL